MKEDERTRRGAGASAQVKARLVRRRFDDVTSGKINAFMVHSNSGISTKWHRDAAKHGAIYDDAAPEWFRASLTINKVC